MTAWYKSCCFLRFVTIHSCAYLHLRFKKLPLVSFMDSNTVLMYIIFFENDCISILLLAFFSYLLHLVDSYICIPIKFDVHEIYNNYGSNKV